jgi:hypothetical protein
MIILVLIFAISDVSIIMAIKGAQATRVDKKALSAPKTETQVDRD